MGARTEVKVEIKCFQKKYFSFEAFPLQFLKKIFFLLKDLRSTRSMPAFAFKKKVHADKFSA
jgi:hypothetical protein